MKLPQVFFKALLAAVAVAVLVIVPGNTKFLFGYGDTSGQFHKFVCENSTPLKVVLYQPNHPALPKTAARGEVILNWLKLQDNAGKYTIAYGVQPGNYIYGVTDTGDVNSFTVKYLNPGTRYYFVVRGVNGCMPGPWSQEWSAVAPGGSGVRDNGTNLTSPRPSVNPSVRPSVRPSVNPSVRPSTVPGTGGPSQPSLFQGLLNWLRGLFK